MTAKENIHGGHRERLINKFVSYPDSLSDHELLEIMLYSFIPRKNTNDIAHNLLDKFGTIEKVFACPSTELVTVEGIGERTAAGIALCGKLYEKIFERRKNVKPQKPWMQFPVYYEEIKPDFENLKDEKLVVYFLDQKFLLFYKLTFTDRVRASVQVDLTELAGKLALKKPRYIIIAHNHPSGDPTPSPDDDATVKKLILLCSTNGCALGDSIIFGKNTAYSYMVERRFENDPEFKVLRDAISLLEGVK